jgi:zinc/manganese transport system ATP-binding protein
MLCSSVNQSFIHIENLFFFYHTKTPILSNFNLYIQSGEKIAIVGPNGSGKTTLMRILVGLQKPSSANILKLVTPVGYLPQLSHIDRSFPITVEQVIQMGNWNPQWRNIFLPQKKKLNEKKIKEISFLLRIDDILHRAINTLSGGQFQKVLCARLWMQGHSWYFLDEPFNFVDEKTQKELLNVIDFWNKEEGKTIIAIVHNEELVKRHFDRVIFLS